MSEFRRFLTCAALGAVALTLSAASASAANVWGKARWHTDNACRYPVKPVIVFYADDWRWGRTDDYRWRREHGARGYLHGNKVIAIEEPPAIRK
jgi:hypothetical protein